MKMWITGFTLVELMIGICIVTMVALAVYPAVSDKTDAIAKQKAVCEQHDLVAVPLMYPSGKIYGYHCEARK